MATVECELSDSGAGQKMKMAAVVIAKTQFARARRERQFRSGA